MHISKWTGEGNLSYLVEPIWFRRNHSRDFRASKVDMISLIRQGSSFLAATSSISDNWAQGSTTEWMLQCLLESRLTGWRRRGFACCHPRKRRFCLGIPYLSPQS